VKKLGRRLAIVGGFAGAGLLGVGFWFARERDRLGDRKLLHVKSDEVGLNGWVKIGRDNTVTVAVPRAEMGQGVQTALAMLVAEELDARWNQIKVEEPPESAVYRNVDILIDGLPFSPEEAGTVVEAAHWVAGKLGGVLGVNATGGSTSVRDAWLPMRTAGAVARDLLLRAASRKAGLPVTELTVVDGEVRKLDGTKVATFGELVDSVGDLAERPPPPLKKPADFKLIGKPLPRVDVLAKVTGAATFGIDVRLPGLLYAAIRNAPTFGGEALSFTLKQEKLPKGIEKVVIVPGGIAAIGTSWWTANRFLDDGIDVKWQAGPEPTLESAGLWKRYAELLETGKPALTRTLGTETKPAQVQVLTATYRAPYLAHTAMEPMNCTAKAGPQGVEVWMPNQSPTLMRLVAAKVAGVPQDQVSVHTTFLGGGFGRRAEVDLVRQAVTCALAMPERPIQLLWSREEDVRHDFYRPMALARWRADIETAGGAQKLVGVAKRQVAQSPTDQFPARTIGLPVQGQPEGNAVENPPYAFPFYRLDAIVAEGGGAGRLLAVGRPFAHRLLRRMLRRRAGGGPEERPVRVPPRTAGGQAPPPEGAGDGGAGSGMGHTSTSRLGPRHRAPGVLRLDRGAGRRGRRAGRQDPAGQARYLCNRLRTRGQSGDRARADGERHRLRPVRRALRRDHPGQRRRRAGELLRLRRRSVGRGAGNGRALGR
jgi:isoquinoline 1-oxidoreductase beta subunit